MGGQVSGTQVTNDLTWLLPGVFDQVKCPNSWSDGAPRLDEGRAYCPPHGGSILTIVQHLNDACHWTRETVADWLETLDVDLTFPTEPPPRPAPLIEPEYPVPPKVYAVCNPSTCPICSGSKLSWMPNKTTIWLDVEGDAYVNKAYVNGVSAGFVVTDEFAKYFKSEPGAWSIADPDASEKTLDKLSADKVTPELLKRPDGTVPPALDTESFLKTTESFPTVTLFPGALKHVETEYPTSNDNYNTKGKRRGKHRRS